MPYVCSNCGKIYKDAFWYKKHIETCKIIANIDRKEELTNIELTKTVQYLLEVVREQDTVLKSLKRWASREKKKCNIIEWLNSCCDDTITISNYMKSLEINSDHLKYIFKYDFVEGISTILENILIGCNIPIRCFDKDKNKFYIKTDKWICDISYFYKFIDHIVSCLIKINMENTSKSMTLLINEKTNERYLKNMKILMINGSEKNNKYQQIHKKIFVFLKENLKNIVEYEFTF